jgi:hypothetical protein
MITTTTQGIFAGVCLSTARPTTPYLGQVIFETDTNKMKVWLGSVWSDGYTHVYTPPSDFDSIATVTVGSTSQTTITFSDIPQTYKHLQLRIMAKGNLATTVYSVGMRFNSDSGTNYSYHRLTGNGSSASSTGSYPQSTIYFDATGTTATNIFAASMIDIVDYTNTNKYKTVKTLGGYDNNGAGSVGLQTSVWSSTAAITNISFTTVGYGDWLQYSQFALYGIKG